MCKSRRFARRTLGGIYRSSLVSWENKYLRQQNQGGPVPDCELIKYCICADIVLDGARLSEVIVMKALPVSFSPTCSMCTSMCCPGGPETLRRTTASTTR